MSGRIPWDEITDRLLERYGGQAPRYTSYPTAVEWTGQFTSADLGEALRRADRQGNEPLSLYVHIPYCKKRCRFCGCASDVCDDTAAYDRYLDAIAKEVPAIARHLPNRREVAHLHLGGGTPTVLDPSRLARLITIIQSSFDTARADEMAIEAAPSVTTIEQVEALADLKFNRISLGVQDFTPAVQEAVDRVQSADHTQRLIEAARGRGFGVNIDLIYGLPRQTPDTWRENLKRVIALTPDRLAVFGYAHVPWMRPNQQALDDLGLPDADSRLTLFRIAHDALLEAGYVYIGMDHFARSNDTLVRAQQEGRLFRNFQGYTVKHGSDLIGLGATAISDIGGAFAQNHAKTDQYLSMTGASGQATYRGMVTSAEDRMRRHIITELMCHLTVCSKEISDRFGIDFWSQFKEERLALTPLVQDGLVEVDDDVIRVTPRGRLFVRHVCLVFDTYSQKKNSGDLRFSRTV